MKTEFTDQFDFDFLLNTMMGPNAMRLGEEMASYLSLQSPMHVLDLGCGMGLTSILLAKKYGVRVTAADLWIAPDDNLVRFRQMGVDEQVTPVSLDVTGEIPFEENTFDVIFSVDAYHYFGCNTEMLPKLLAYLKPGGIIAVAIPGLKQPIPEDSVPEELLPYWEENMNFFTVSWWRELWGKAKSFRLEDCREMPSCRRAWEDWLQSPNPYAQQDVGMLEAEGGRYFNMIQLIGKKL